MVEKKPKTISETVLEIVCRFLGGAFFGGLIALIIFFSVFSVYARYYRWGYSPDAGYWKRLVLGIPLLWGIMSIFWFDKMLEIGSKFLEAIFHRD